MTTTASAAEAHFRAVVPGYMRLLLKDFPELDILDAAAVFGNGGHESKGLTDDQEDAPVVEGSRGGRNWMQWTGPRRKEFEAYCARNNLDPDSDVAAYKWLFLELKGAEKKAIPALLAAKTLKAKVEAFEKAFLRAGVKRYDSRLRWAEIALDAFGDTASSPSPAEPRPIPAQPMPAPKSPTTRPSLLALVVIVVLAALAGFGFWLFQQQAAEPASVVSFPAGAPVPLDRPVPLFGSPGGGTNLVTEIGFQILLAFVGPLISAAATAAVGWVVYWWGRVLKTDFDQKSADSLHAALERGILAAIEHFGARAAPAKLTAHAAEYANKWSGGTVKRFGLSHDDLQQLAEPHLAAVKLGSK